MTFEVAVLGAGYVGVTTAATLAERGFRVTLVDPVEAKVDRIRDGEVPFHEPGLDTLVAEQVAAGRLRAQATSDPATAPDYVFLCVGTPSRPDGGVDLTQVQDAARDAARLAGARTTVVVKSTVPPGTCRTVVRPILDAEGAEDAGLAANPEFLREGSALDDARDPDRVVVGADDDATRKAMEALYADVEAPVHVYDLDGAEAVKYLANAFLALKISFANEAANLCQALDMDLVEVMEAVAADDRIAPDFFVPGAGFGGSCFPKDVEALRTLGDELGVETRILDAVLETNAAQPSVVADLADDALGGLEGRTVGLLGLAFKAGTDDVRETRAAPLHEALVDRGASVRCHDPEAASAFQDLVPDAEICDLEHALDTDLCVLQAAWPIYLDLPPEAWPPVVVDARRAIGPELRRALEAAGVEVHAVGRGVGP